MREVTSLGFRVGCWGIRVIFGGTGLLVYVNKAPSYVATISPGVHVVFLQGSILHKEGARRYARSSQVTHRGSDW